MTEEARTGNPIFTPTRVLAFVCVTYLVLATLVALGTAPWEANDEQYHAQNVETLRNGRWYRIPGESGLESHQPPLYYLGLAGYADALGVPSNATAPVQAPAPGFAAQALYVHGTRQDAADERYVRLLRLPSLLLGLATILLTWATARLVSRDRWTPVVAAAVCALLPKFVFLSGVINNDNLANALGALAAFAAVAVVVRPIAGRQQVAWSVAFGALLAALLLTKLSTLPLAAGMLLALVFMALRGSGDRARRVVFAVAGFGVTTALFGGWWLVRNIDWYGDPFATSATRRHFDRFAPVLTVDPGFGFHRAFVDLPKGLWRNVWYVSGWDQFSWNDPWYLPFWLLLGVGVIGLAWPRRDRFFADPARLRAVIVLAVFALGALVGYWIIGFEASGVVQGRVVFVGLAPIATLVALGYERLRLPAWSRFALPVLGVVGVAVALSNDVFGLYA